MRELSQKSCFELHFSCERYLHKQMPDLSTRRIALRTNKDSNRNYPKTKFIRPSRNTKSGYKSIANPAKKKSTTALKDVFQFDVRRIFPKKIISKNRKFLLANSITSRYFFDSRNSLVKAT